MQIPFAIPLALPEATNTSDLTGLVPGVGRFTQTHILAWSTNEDVSVGTTDEVLLGLNVTDAAGMFSIA